MMDDALNETAAVARAEGVDLGEKDIEAWHILLDSLGPEGKTSMLQDMEAGRKTEVESFAGELMRRAEKHRIDVPVNRSLYAIIKTREALD